MNITILDNRDVIINSSDNLGTQNENNASFENQTNIIRFS